MTDNHRGALLMTLSMVSFTINDAFLKLILVDLPLVQVLALRSACVLLMMIPLAAYLGALRFRLQTRDWRLIGIRSVAEVAAAYFFLTALKNMPIANATAIIQALPLTVCLAGAVFLGEVIGWRRMLAIAIGFVGVLLIIQPTSDGFTIYSLYVLAAVVFVTIRDIAARQLSPELPSVSVAVFTVISLLIAFGLASTTIDWAPMTTPDWVFLTLAAATVIGGYVFSVAAMRVGQIGAVSPFRYTSILAALLIGFIVFDEWPNNLTLAGAAIVVVAGVITIRRAHHSS